MTRIIGIAGTAKNTGKTTSMTALMEEVYKKGLTLGLTSIGYDGEVMDNVTGLPKPRVKAQAGTIVAIAKGCLDGSTAQIEILRETEIKTALGKIIIGVVKEPGLVVIAGPNKSSEVRRVNEILGQAGCELVFVDGALNRIAPMVETDGLLVATGASRTTDIPQLAQETRSLAQLFGLSLWTPRDVSSMTISSLLTEGMVKDMLQQLTPDSQEILVSGIIGEYSFNSLLELGREKLAGKTLVLTDPIKILVAGAPDKMLRLLEQYEQAGISVKVKKNIRLLAVTMNPFYPKYRYVSHDYEAAFVDKDEMKEALTAACPVPVVDVMSEGVERLWSHLGI